MKSICFPINSIFKKINMLQIDSPGHQMKAVKHLEIPSAADVPGGTVQQHPQKLLLHQALQEVRSETLEGDDPVESVPSNDCPQEQLLNCSYSDLHLMETAVGFQEFD